MEQISPLIQRQYLSGAQSTITKWTVKAGGVFPLHHHANEQTTWLTKGRCELYSQGKKYVLTAGSVLIIPPNVPHELTCSEDSIDIDFFAPQRQDWMDGVQSIAVKASQIKWDQPLGRLGPCALVGDLIEVARKTTGSVPRLAHM